MRMARKRQYFERQNGQYTRHQVEDETAHQRPGQGQQKTPTDRGRGLKGDFGGEWLVESGWPGAVDCHGLPDAPSRGAAASGQKQIQGTAYFLTQLGGFYMNPKTTINGEEIELRPLGTEGQGTVLNKKGTYSNFQLCVPLGIGAKAQIGKRVTFNIDLGIRKTFTDYMDHVKSATFVDPSVLAQYSGEMAAALSNQSLDGARNGYRGNPTTKDWYVYAGGMVSVRLGRGRKCFKLR